MNKSYRWTKVWAVQTDAEDTVDEGDLIVVESAAGESKQRVLSVTSCQTKSGKPYLTLLVHAE
jgi:uncharacterized Zn finger protein